MTDQANKVSGNVSVPREPTQQMLEAALLLNSRWPHDHWKAMIDAAPIEQHREIPVAGGEVEVFEVTDLDSDGGPQMVVSAAEHLALVTRLQAEVEVARKDSAGWRAMNMVSMDGKDRLRAERDALQSELTNEKAETVKRLEWAKEAAARIDSLESDLTKARELLKTLLDENEGIPAAQETSTGFVWYALHHAQTLIREYLAHQSAPAATCKTCNGTGIEYDGAGHTCTACNGSKLAPAAKGKSDDR